MTLNLHAILPRSRANGPGVRMTLWFQGCTLGCVGCFNPETHSSEPKVLMSVDDLVARVVAEQGEIEGISISGGEPLQQAEGLLKLVSQVRTAELSVLLFSGYDLTEIQALPLGPEILAGLDVLIAGRYDDRLHLAQSLRGSSNQQIHLLTDRYSMADVERTPPAEVHIDRAGNVVVSGVRPASLGSQ